MDFDDYNWTLRGSSLDPTKVPQIAEQYTDEQIDSCQVQMIVDELVRRDGRYRQVFKDKISGLSQRFHSRISWLPS